MHRYLSVFVAVMLFVTFGILPVSANQQAFDCAAVTEIPLAECQALVALYNSTNGPDWKVHTNWLATNTPSNWSGIAVASGHVYSINLGSNLLAGVIPPQIGNLSGLQYLILYGNQLNGSIPQEIGSLVELKQLFLDGNALTGGVPATLGNLVKVEQFYLRNNLLTGSIPPQLVGLTSVQGMDLSNNQLSGGIPTQLGSLANLYFLNLSGNRLTGSIPSALGNLINLTALELESNQLSGAIPPELGNLGKLTRLFLYSNQLSGSIPAELGALVKLQNLYLLSNQLSGSIPAQLGSMTALKSVVIVNNQLTGSIPPELGNLTNLQQLYLNNNQLTGSIPPELGNLTNLQQLYLNSNQLTGSIPAELGALVKLQNLYLFSNQLTGDVPDTLINLQAIGDGNNLDLSYNRLNIPAGYPQDGNAFHSWLSTKDPDWHQQQAFEQTVGAGGGTMTSLDGKTDLYVSSGALEDGTVFDYIPQAAPTQATGNLRFGQNSFQIHAEDAGGDPVTTFMKPLLVTITYTDEDIAGMYEDRLKLFYWNESSLEWQDAASTCPDGKYTRDLAGNTFTVPVCHFSEFAVLDSTTSLFLPVMIR